MVPPAKRNPEPPTSHVRSVVFYPAELRGQWRWEWDSNPRIAALQAAALNHSAIPSLVWEAGFEPAISCSPNTRSAPYQAWLLPDGVTENWENGARGRSRTYNLRIKSPLLCQLSYACLWCPWKDSNLQPRTFEAWHSVQLNYRGNGASREIRTLVSSLAMRCPTTGRRTHGTPRRTRTFDTCRVKAVF